MFPEKCKALLKSSDNTLLERGYVTVDIGSANADFTGEFVPLNKIGTAMKIVCIEKGHSTHIVTGKVYLSSPSLMRLTDITCRLLDGAERYLSARNIAVTAKLRPANARAGILRHEPAWRACTVTELSLGGAVIRCPALAGEPAEEFVLRLSAPVFTRETEILLRRTGKSSVQAEYEIPSDSNDFDGELAVFMRTAALSVLGTRCED